GTRLEFKIFNILAQSLVEDQKRIDILLEKPDSKLISIVPAPCVDIVHDIFDHIHIIAPSIVYPLENIPLIIRIHDTYKNLVKDFTGALQLKLNDKIIPLQFDAQYHGFLKLYAPAFSSEGTYTLSIAYNDMVFYSNPMVCREHKKSKKLYWGYIHGHTLKSDGIRSIEEYFENMIKAGLDFGTATEHDHLWETTDKDFEEIKKIVKDATKVNEFISLFGYEYGTWYTGYGDICIYYEDEELPIFRSEINKFNSTNKLIQNLTPFKGDLMMIAHHTALRPGYRNWDVFNNELEKLVESYSTWGNQEYPSSEGNPLPPRYKFFGYGPYAKKRGPILEKKGSFVQDALAKGYKLGFTAGGDDHFGIYPSGMIDPDNGIYPPGIMAIWAETLTKESIWNAMQNRKCYGTTGPRVIVELYVDEYFMGDIINIQDKQEFEKKRTIRINLLSPIKILKLELIRNNKILKEIAINHTDYAIQIQDLELFDNICLKHSQENEFFTFYYLRIFLDENHMAWSSPIWIIKTL
ncbi:MAG: DUF3604 domain-containing protein, partial [Promethearchaeota archaeon]